jgi:hypothetical protein
MIDTFVGVSWSSYESGTLETSMAMDAQNLPSDILRESVHIK